MRTFALAASLVLVSACGGKPISYFTLTPQPAGDAYSCALRKINELGYTISNTNRDAGFIVGDKQTSGTASKILLRKENHDQLTVSVFDDASTAKRKIRVTAASTEATSNLFSSQTSATSPSDAAIADANAVLRTCGDGEITKQEALHRFTATELADAR